MRSTLYALLARFTRPLRFGLVGLSGMLVNSAVLWALVVGVKLPMLLASVMATEMAILSNFMLNDRWTFGSVARERSLGQRLLRFNGVALGGMAITSGTLILLTSYGRLPLLIANLLAVGAAMVWNYVVNSRWTWKRTPLERRPIITAKDAKDAKKRFLTPFRSSLLSLRDWMRLEYVAGGLAVSGNLQSAPADSAQAAHRVEEVALSTTASTSRQLVLAPPAEAGAAQ